MKLVSRPGGLAAFEQVHLSAAVPPCSLIAMRNRGPRELFKLVVFFAVRRRFLGGCDAGRHGGWQCEVVVSRRLPLPRVLQPAGLGSSVEVCEVHLRGATSIARQYVSDLHNLGFCYQNFTNINCGGVTCRVVHETEWCGCHM